MPSPPELVARGRSARRKKIPRQAAEPAPLKPEALRTPRAPTARPAPMRDQVIAQKPLRGGEEVRVLLQDYHGRSYLHVRRFYPAGEQLLPGKGAALDVHLLPWLRTAIVAAEAAALAAGLLDEEAYESADLPLPAELTR